MLVRDMIALQARRRVDGTLDGPVPAARYASVRWVQPAWNRNQVRCSASSIQFSSRRAVATSPCSSQRSWVSRVECELFVVVAQLGQHVLRGHIVGVVVQDALQPGDMPIERSVVPPSLRMRSAMASVVAKICVGLIGEHQIIIAKVGPEIASGNS